MDRMWGGASRGLVCPPTVSIRVLVTWVCYFM